MDWHFRDLPDFPDVRGTINDKSVANPKYDSP